MPRSLRSFLALFLSVSLVLSACKTTQKAGPATDSSSKRQAAQSNTLLWKVEGKDLEQPSYVFGTIHIISSDDYFLPAGLTAALESTQQLVLELDMDEPGIQMQALQYINMKDGMTLDKLISPEDYTSLNKLISEATGASLDMFKSWIPTMLSSLFIAKYIEGPPTSYEAKLMEMAKAQEKEVLGLETMQEQFAAMDQIPYKEQASYLVEIAKDFEKSKKDFASLVNSYKTQDIQELHDEIIRQSGGSAFAEFLVYQRNEKWIDRIGQMAKQKSSFFAVGSGHLGGEKGVISLLKKAGYSVNPVLD